MFFSHSYLQNRNEKIQIRVVPKRRNQNKSKQTADASQTNYANSRNNSSSRSSNNNNNNGTNHQQATPHKKSSVPLPQMSSVEFNETQTRRPILQFLDRKRLSLHSK